MATTLGWARARRHFPGGSQGQRYKPPIPQAFHSMTWKRVGWLLGEGHHPFFDPALGQALTAIPLYACSERSWDSDASLVLDTDLFPFTVELG